MRVSIESIAHLFFIIFFDQEKVIMPVHHSNNVLILLFLAGLVMTKTMAASLDYYSLSSNSIVISPMH